ncbi:LAME_0B05820g1_1 [Lachancea meyersii CBS 8951]|uniref:ATPase inhibitor, mitochondrial n=1 Tax=Lachancea meyersii CBS 8951 TaxID=1266667 RepID=A0A1G4IVX1_9SACH|nr:LAME_0B05820g1_1 [Lachancea meyersii CBS 8951]
MLALTTRNTLRQSLKLQCGMASRCYTEGSTGSPRGESAEDAFVKRERAQEDYYIRKHEKDQLAQLRQKITEQQKKIDHLEDQLNGKK